MYLHKWLPNQSSMASLLIIFLIFLSSFSSSAQSDDFRYKNCSSTFNCGSSLANLSYPFWSDTRPDYCGHPGFKLSCPASNSQKNVTISLGSQTLDVLDINMDLQSMTVLYPDFSTDPCPQNLQNITLDQTIYNFTSNVRDVTFFYGCSFYSGQQPNFTCPKQSHLSGMTVYYAENSISKDWTDRLNRVCAKNVVVPMLESAVETMRSDYVSVWDRLRQGFEVEWTVWDGCRSCGSSGGMCGFDWSSTEKVCYCKDGARVGGCNGSSFSSTSANSPADGEGYGNSVPVTPPNPGSKNKTIIVAGVGIAVFATTAILAAAAYLWYRRRNKKLHQPFPDAVSRRKYSPSDPSALSNLENGDSFLGVNLFHYDELEEATEYFNPSKELGEGGFGIVYYGKLGDGREVAIKRMFENSSKQVEQFMTEIQILTHLRHKNLVTLYGCTSRHSRELLLVYEYVSNGTVADHLHSRKSKLSPNTTYSPLSWTTRLSIAVETASALLYLHASDIIHRDVKTNNILLDDHYTVKVADFGLSRLFPLDLTHVSTAPQGTPGYVDPEYHQCYQLTDKSDVYSFGVVLAELISTKPAVDITRHRHEINLSNLAINKIQNDALHELVDPTLGFDENDKTREQVSRVAELAFQCLQQDRDMRPNMEEVLQVLARIQEHHDGKMEKNIYLGIMKPEVVDIPAEEALRLKSDLSPGSSSGSKGKIHGINNTNTSHSC